MMGFPMWYLLVPFAFVLFCAALFLFFNVYHIAKFGIESPGTYTLIAVYLGGFFVLTIITAVLFARYDWGQEVTPGDILPSQNAGLTNYGL
jgi:hypothetical protein